MWWAVRSFSLRAVEPGVFVRFWDSGASGVDDIALLSIGSGLQ